MLAAIAADEIRVGELLWSSASERELRVVAVHREQLRADGNLAAWADPEQPGTPTATAIVLTVVDELTRETQRLGGYAPRARLQVVRHRPRAATA